MILAIANGALGTDQTILDNKTEVGLYSAEKGVNDVDDATNIMRDVDETDKSVELAKSLADSYAVLTLTDKTDTLVGDAGDNIFDGLLSAGGSTYTVGDSMDGGEGEDTFKLQITGGTDASATLTNIETVEITGSAKANLNTFNWSGVTEYSVNNNLGTSDFNNIKESIDNISITNQSAANVFTLNFMDDTIVDTDNDILGITLKDSSQKVTLATQAKGIAEVIYEEVNIHSTGNTGIAEIDITQAGDIAKVTIDGDSSIILNGTSGTMTKTTLVDASALEKGGLNYSSKSVLTETILGGEGDDTIVAAVSAKAIVKGGDGDDSITITAGGSDVWGGNGLDKIILTGGSSNVKYDKIEETGLTTATADQISTFASATDTISFRSGVEGSDANFLANTTDLGLAGADDATIELAVAAANEVSFNGKNYLYFSESATHKILVVDLNGDGTADGAIDLLAAATFTADDIVAY